MVDMNKLTRKAEKIATKTVEKTVGKLIPKMTLKQQVGLTRVYMRQLGVVDTRRRIIDGLSDEFEELKNKTPDITVDEIIRPYLECKDFMELWTEWGLNKDHLEVLAKGDK